MPPTRSSPSRPGRTRLLVIDDDRELCALIRDYLEPLGYDVTAVHNGLVGVDQAMMGNFEVIILDVMLPGLDGFEALKRIRQQSNVPILMLTARGEESDRVAGLEVGADDYLPKTFSTRELLARLRAVMRRTSRPTAGAQPADEGDAEVVVGELRLHPGTRTMARGDKAVELTAIEFDLLECLMRARGRVKSREQLLEAITDRNYDVFDRSIDVHIWSLRKKLGDDPKNPRFVRTLRAVGYMLINPDAE